MNKIFEQLKKYIDLTKESLVLYFGYLKILDIWRSCYKQLKIFIKIF